MKPSIRVYALARQLNVDFESVLSVAHRYGLNIPNALSTIRPEDREIIERAIKRSGPEPDGETDNPVVVPRTPPRGSGAASAENPPPD